MLPIGCVPFRLLSVSLFVSNIETNLLVWKHFYFLDLMFYLTNPTLYVYVVFRFLCHICVKVLSSLCHDQFNQYKECRSSEVFRFLELRVMGIFHHHHQHHPKNCPELPGKANFWLRVIRVTKWRRIPIWFFQSSKITKNKFQLFS